jgi:Universal stress protein UspA and related nucleotide-binding proteins
MYGHILIATDGSDVATRGVDHGLSLAKALGARVTVVFATEPFPFPSRAIGAGWSATATDMERYEASQKDYAEGVLKAVRDRADAMGVKAETVHVPDAHPATAIIDTAKARDCSLIVMASHGRRGIGRLILGSQTAEVLSHSPVPVHVVR